MRQDQSKDVSEIKTDDRLISRQKKNRNKNDYGNKPLPPCNKKRSITPCCNSNDTMPGCNYPREICFKYKLTALRQALFPYRPHENYGHIIISSASDHK